MKVTANPLMLSLVISIFEIWQGLEMPDLDMAGQAGDLDLGGLDM